MPDWTSAEAYERRVGRWSRLVAHEFLPWVAPERGLAWLDVGCGTGTLARAIVETRAPRSVVGIDPAADDLAYARERAGGRIEFHEGRAERLPFPDRAFDVVVSGLALNFFADQPRAMAELKRVLRAGGAMGAYVWDFAGEMQMMRRFWDAARALDPAAAALDFATLYPDCKPEPLARAFRAAGFAQVATRAIDAPTLFRDFDDLWLPMAVGSGTIPDYVQGLGEERRAALKERLRASLPAAADGTIPLIARAWAVKGTREA